MVNQEGSLKSRIAMFNNNSAAKETRADPFKMEDPFKSDLFKGVNTSSSLLIYSFFCNDCGSVSCCLHSVCIPSNELFLLEDVNDGGVLFLDPFGSDPFKESDPFKGTSSEDFFKTTDRPDLFGSGDPFSRKPVPPVKVLTFSPPFPKWYYFGVLIWLF